jgi:hypothetical protein
MGAYHKLANGFSAFWETLQQIGDYLRPVVIPLLADLKKLIIDIAEAFGLSDVATKLSASTTGDWAEIGKTLAMALIDITKWLMRFIDYSVKVVELTARFTGLRGAVLMVYDAFKKLESIFDHLMTGWNSFKSMMGFMGVNVGGEEGGPKAQPKGLAGGENTFPTGQETATGAKESIRRTQAPEGNGYQVEDSYTRQRGQPTYGTPYDAGDVSESARSTPGWNGSGPQNDIAAALRDHGNVISNAVKELAGRPVEVNVDGETIARAVHHAGQAISGGEL